MKHKYNAKPVEIDGLRFASQAEGRRYSELCMLQRAGQISDLECQPSFKLTCSNGTPIRYESKRQIRYVADFRYTEKGRVVIEDVKGMDTPASKIKRAIMANMGHPVTVIR